MSIGGLNEAVSKIMQERIDRLSWQCSYCPKVPECESQAAHKSAGVDCVKKYCSVLIDAAFADEPTFKKPFGEDV